MRRLLIMTVVGISLFGAPAQAQPIVDGVVDALYGAPIATDKAGDGQAVAIMDLRALHATSDATTLYLALSIAGDIGATNWGKYVVYIDTTNNAAGATSDAWSRNVAALDPHKPELSINTWVDQPPYGPARVQVWNWSQGAGSWSQSATGVSAAALVGSSGGSVIELAIPRSLFSGAQTIWVEAFSTGGDGSNAQDTVNAPAEDWNAADWSATAQLAVSTEITLASPGNDAGPPDAGKPDAGKPDAGKPDGGAPEGGPPDSGVPDSQPSDLATAADQGTADAGVPDTSSPDVMPSPDTVTNVDQATPSDGGVPDADCGCPAPPDLRLPDFELRRDSTADTNSLLDGGKTDVAPPADQAVAGKDGGASAPGTSSGCQIDGAPTPAVLPLLLLLFARLRRRRSTR